MSKKFYFSNFKFTNNKNNSPNKLIIVKTLII